MPTIQGPAIQEIAGNYLGSNTHYSIFSTNFSVPYDQTVTIVMNCGYTGTGSPPVGRIAQFFLKENSDTVYYNYLQGETSFETIKTLYAGKTYRMELKIQNDYNNNGLMRLTYDSITTPTFYDVSIPTGGVRLRKIKYTSPESQVPYFKYYTYGKMESPSKSSGIGSTEEGYISFNKLMVTCPNPAQGYSLCRYGVMNSNSAFNIFNMSGSHVFYSSVLESDDSLFANGGTEYTFFHPDVAGTSMVILGENVPQIPMDSYGTLNGQLKTIRQFDSSFSLVSEQINHFDTVYPANKTVLANYVRRKWDVLESPPQYFDEMESFDIVQYYYKDVWYQKKSTVTKVYATNNVTSYDSVVYTYGNENNILPFETTSIGSKGDVNKVTVKYPTDYSGVTVLTQMVSKNMITEPVEVFSYKNGNLLQQKKIKYKNWISANDVFKPDTIQVKSSPNASLQDEIYFEKYDSSGNVLQARKINNLPVSYIWNHKKTFPIAQVTNALYDQVAYTSFEGDYAGNWDIQTPEAIQSNLAFTGSHSYSGRITKQILISGEYVVTVWTKDTASIPGYGYGTTIRTVRGWKLQEWVLNLGTGYLSITGSNMDEARIYPKQSVMTSYTYLPFVGIATKDDVNDELAYYEYDGYNRLRIVRDIDSNILKLYRYKYLDTIAACMDFSEQWNVTGNVRCIKNSNNNNSGVQEAEEQNLNSCSQTYLQLRWVSLGTTGNCPPVPNCTGNNKRVVNGVCEVGIKVYTTYVLISPGNYECTYHYEFSDGYWSPNYTELSSYPCFNEA